ncbi:7039_t:CDS:2 [Racocetra persica]|uniref:7039_t:CDS:1 n=1 Tax=Racocetra persica TaxID=160502 RepID=A0ACA9LWF8_9GLOM|nr:7039_t:CDS:2 [Racocetra persica]
MNYTIMYLQDNRLYPSHYVFAPRMFNNSLYKSSRTELKLMTDIDEYLIVENRIHREMTIANKDINTLYLEVITQYMSTEILNKVSPEEILDIQSIMLDTEIGYILEVDLKVLVYLHDYFTDYPLVPEKQIVLED